MILLIMAYKIALGFVARQGKLMILASFARLGSRFSTKWGSFTVRSLQLAHYSAHKLGIFSKIEPAQCCETVSDGSFSLKLLEISGNPCSIAAFSNIVLGQYIGLPSNRF